MRRFVRYFRGTVVTPRKTFQQIASEKSILVGLTPVITFGFLAAITYFVSYLYGASVTMEEVAAGMFGAEPLIPIPKETYRLWESIFILPMYLTAWILLALFARLASKEFGGNRSFRENLNVLGFAYFVPLYFFVVFDFFLIGPAYSWNLAAARGMYGTEVQRFASVLGFLYIGIPFTWSPILTGIAIRSIEKFPLWKTLVVTLLAIIPPNALFTVFIR
jgi:hypothetical protein